METANHGYLLLQNTFEGNFLGFYENVTAHANEFYYVNSAHYNIVLYIVFAIWELPVFIINSVFSLSVNQSFLWIWAKLLVVAFSLMNALLIRRLITQSVDEETGKLSFFAFVLSPVAFFLSAVMGQYESLSVFFILLALFFYKKGGLVKFSALMGVAILFKSFAVLIVIPLLFLAEKKVLKLLLNAVIVALPSLVTGLLFSGRITDAEEFNRIMTGRLFDTVVFNSVPVFPLMLAVVCAVCWLTRFPEQEKERLRLSAAVSLGIFAAMALLVEIHPQWVYLIIPFLIITVFLERNRTLYYYISILLSFGLTLFCWRSFPQHFEASMLNGGLFTLLGLPAVQSEATMVMVLRAVPILNNIASALFAAAVAVIIAAYIPFSSSGSLAQRSAQAEVISLAKCERTAVWVVFAVGIGFWLGSVLYFA